MSDISNFYSSSSSKRRLSEIDDTIEYLTQEVNTLNDFMYKSEFRCCLRTVKMKREKVKVLSAIAKSHVLIANMDVLIAESELFTDIERLRNRNFKRMKLDHNEDELQVTPASTKTTVAVQTIESMFNKKKKTRHSCVTCPVHISSAKTVVIPTIHESSASLVGNSQTSPTSLSQGLFNKMPADKSDSEVLLSSSFKAKFNNEPYSKTQTQETVKKSPTETQKAEKRFESKSKSKHTSKRTQSPTASAKMVADLRKSVYTASNQMESSSQAVSTQNSSTGDQKPMACATYVPSGHNMVLLLTQPSTATMHQLVHVNPATHANIQYHSQKADK